MDERFEISLLLDYYGQLLTEKQRDIMDLYYNQDLSLLEIGELKGISRQAVFDLIKRCHNLLSEYEDKLRLMERNLTIESSKGKIIKKLESLKKNEMLHEHKGLIDEIINDINECI